jgi:transposase-like protein
VIRPLGVVPTEAAARIRAARDAKTVADAELRAAVVAALEAGGSVREVAKVAGLNPDTVQRWSQDR